METIKLYVKPAGAKERGGAYNLFELEKYSKIKFYTKDEIVSLIAKKMKQPITEVKKQKSLVNKAFKQMREMFLEKTIIDIISYSISLYQFRGKITANNLGSNDLSYIQKSFDEKTKTYNILLNYKGCIQTHKKLSKYRYYDMHKNNKKDYKDWAIHTNQLHNYKKYPDGNIPFMEDNVIPKYVKNWCTKKGEEQIDFILDNLNNKKLKIEIYSKSLKKINTYYVNLSDDFKKLKNKK